MATLVGFSSLAAADGAGASAGIGISAKAPKLPVGFGARVGGYGFRNVSGEDTIWNECRMDGLGLFGNLGLGRYLFGELGLDFYQAKGTTVAEDKMDRLSTQLSAAVGLRMFPTATVSPYIQGGLGAEVAQVQLTHGPQSTRLYPFGFIGVGGDVKIGPHLRLGANLRFHMMAHFDEQSVASASQLSATPNAAAQAQFFMRYDL